MLPDAEEKNPRARSEDTRSLGEGTDGSQSQSRQGREQGEDTLDAQEGWSDENRGSTVFEPDPEVQEPARGTVDVEESLAAENPGSTDFGSNVESSDDEKEAKDMPTKVASFLSSLKAKYNFSNAGIQEIYQFFVVDNAEGIWRAKARSEFPSLKTLKRRQELNHPRTMLWYKVLNAEGREETVTGRETLPHELTVQRDRVLCLCAYNDLQELHSFYSELHTSGTVKENCCSNQKRLFLSSDGVEQTRSGKRRQHVISVMFNGCQQPIPWMVFEYLPGHKPNLDELFGTAVKQCLEHGFTVEQMCVDGLEQQAVRGMVSTGGYYSCARCPTKGTKAGNLPVHFPLKDMSQQKRTHQDFAAFPKEPELNQEKTETQMGIKQRTPLVELPGFDVVEDIGIDALHCLHGGIMKKMWERLFSPHSPFERKALRDLVERRWNDIFTMTPVTSEIHRRTCQINPPDMKGSQWQVIDTFCLVSFALDLEGPEDVKILLLLFAFIIRVLYIEDEQFAEVETRLNLDRTFSHFYKLHGRVFGKHSLTFNMHSLYHALEYRRKKGPMWKYCTSRFESMYAKTKKCYWANAANVPKQLLTAYHAYQKQNHHCKLQRKLKFTQRKTKKVDDTFIYHGGKFYYIEDLEDQRLTVKRLCSYSLNTSKLVKLPWSLVGVQTVGFLSKEPSFTLEKSLVKAKAIISHKIISSMYPEWVVI